MIPMPRIAARLALLLVPAVAAAQPPRVVRAGAPAWGATPRLVEELRIGVAEGDEQYMFGRIEGFAIAPGGGIVVGDDQVPVLRMYDARGRYLRDIGRRGEGPGEYRSIAGLGTLPDGRIALWDNRIQRLTVYGPDGKYRSSFHVPSGLFDSDRFRVSRDGSVYVKKVTAIDRSTNRAGASGGFARCRTDASRTRSRCPMHRGSATRSVWPMPRDTTGPSAASRSPR
jgi:hypothetical protein